MPEQFPYNLAKAQEEAGKMQEKIRSGEAESYGEAEKLVDGILAPKYSVEDFKDMARRYGVSKKKVDEMTTLYGESKNKNIEKDLYIGSVIFYLNNAKKLHHEIKEFSHEINNYMEDTSVVTVMEKIENKQKVIEQDILKKVQDIYSDNFAFHETSIENILSTLEYGILSRDYSRKHKEDLKSLKGMIKSPEINSSFDEQGTNKISTFSVSPLLKTIDRLEKNNYSDNVFGLFIKIDKNLVLDDERRNEIVEDAIRSAIEKLREDTSTDELKVSNFVVTPLRVHKYVGFEVNIELDRSINHPIFSRQKTLEAFFYSLYPIIIEYLKRKEGNFDGIIDKSFYKILAETRELFIEGFGKDAIQDMDHFAQYLNMTDNKCEEIYGKIDKDKLKNALLDFSYDCEWQGYPGLLIDISKIDNVDVSNSTNMIFELSDHENAPIVSLPLIERGYIGETSVFEKIKNSAITGVVLREAGGLADPDALPSDNYSPIKSLELIKNILKTINIDNIKGTLGPIEIELLQNVQKYREIDNKDLLLLASKICNYNLFKEDLSRNDIVLAMANLYKLPVYDKYGDIVWPKKMSHKEVKKFAEERDKEKEQKES